MKKKQGGDREGQGEGRFVFPNSSIQIRQPLSPDWKELAV